MREIKHGLESVKTQLSGVVGEQVVFIVNRGRNKIEKFEGYVVNLHPNVFTVNNLSDDVVQTFAYSDLLTKNVVLSRCRLESNDC